MTTPTLGTKVNDAERWHAISVAVVLRTETGARVKKSPHPPVHGKQMGTMSTACGLDTSNWFGFLDQPFPTPRVQVCQDCLRVVTRGHLAPPPS